MALIKTISLENNFGQMSTFKDAYIRISRVDTTKLRANAYAQITAEKDGQFLTERYFEFSPDLTVPENIIRQAYSALKELPEFIDAVDC